MRPPAERDILRATTFDQLFAAVRAAVAAATGYTRAWLYLPEDDPVTRVRVIDPAGGFDDDAWELAPVLAIDDDAVLAPVFAAGSPVIVDDARTDPRTDKRLVVALGHRTLIVVPLPLAGEAWGALGVGTFGDDGCRPPTPDQIAALAALTAVIAVAAGQVRLAASVVRAAEGRLRAVIRTAHEGFIEMDAEGRIAEWNPEAEAIFGWTRTEVIGRRVGDTIVAPGLRDAHHRGLQRYLATGDGPILNKRLELTAVHRDGRLFPIELTVAVVTASGRPRFAAFVRDITERRRDQELLARARDDAETAMREYEAFSYSVAHDLRAPLRGIDGYSKILLEDHAAQLDAEGVRYLEKVRASTHHMAQLIEDLLALARVNRADLRRTRVDLTALARMIVARLHGDGERDVEVVIEDDLSCDGDPRLLSVVLDNLLGNAWKFTAKRSAARIELGRDGGGFFVRDNGAGFDMAYVDKLFGVFQRLHTVREFEGTGIGLATVARIVRRHGGRVWANGVVGDGATFHFTLDDR